MSRCERVQVLTLDDGRTLRARLWPGDGAPLVLLHGALSSAATWRPLVRATTRRCVALDLPGFGASSPATAAHLQAYADDVLAALRILGISRFVLVGHSFGGAVAIAIAGRCAGVEELVLLAPGGHGSCGLSRLAIDPALGAFAAVLVPILACSSALAARPSAAELPARRARLLALWRELQRAATVGTANARTAVQANEHETGHGHAAAACAQRCGAPITVVWGSRDRVLAPSHADAVLRALPGSRLLLLAGAGHAVHRERATTIAALVA